MQEVTFKRVADEARSLTPAEHCRLRRMLGSWLSQPPSAKKLAELSEGEKHHLLLQRPLEDGIISHIPSGERTHQNFKAIRVVGRPVSETFLEDRR